MLNKMDQLISAVEGLKTESNLLLDYLYPMVMSFIGALLGAGVAIFAFKYQKKYELEKNKVDNVNKVTLNAQKAYETLASMKLNYCSRLDSNPFQRMVNVKYILFNEALIDDDLSGIAFLAAYFDTKSKKKKWLNLSRISKLFATYNDLIGFWDKRNELILLFNEKMTYRKVETGYIEFTVDDVYKNINGPELHRLIDLTEKVIMLTDETLIELESFLSKFPKLSKKYINTKTLEKHNVSELLSFEFTGDIQELTINRTTAPDFKHVEKLYGSKASDINKLYNSPY